MNEEYGFYGRLKKDFPSQVIIDLTEVCNLECTHCSHKMFVDSSNYTGAFLDKSLSDKAVDEVKNEGNGLVEYIRYTGEGEPFFHKAVFDILKYAVDNSGVNVAMTSNGTMIDEERALRFFDTGTDLIDISIDAFSPETYAKIRRKGDLNITRKNVQNLIALKRSHNYKTRIVVSYIEQPQNTMETALFESFWKNEGADFVVIRRMHSNSGTLISKAKELASQYADTQRIPCVYPWERIILNPRGFLAFCPADWTLQATIPEADYRNVSIKEIWNSKFYSELRQAHLDNEFSKFQFCGKCPDWSQVRWPEKGKGYADLMNTISKSPEK